MRSFVLAAALALPVAASAQTGALEVQLNQSDAYVAGTDDCDTLLSGTYSINVAPRCGDFKIWLSAADCGDAPGTGEKVLHTVGQVDTPPGTFDLVISDLPLFATEACGAAVEETFNVCASVKRSTSFSQDCSTTEIVRDSTPATVAYDGLAPEPPTLDSVTALDGALSVAVHSPGGTATIRVDVRLPGSEEVIATNERPASAAGVRVSGLQNGVEYELYGYATDEAGNTSAASEPVRGTPIDTLGFGQTYKNMGGSEEGGCSAVGGATGALWGLLFGGFVVLRRRSWR